MLSVTSFAEWTKTQAQIIFYDTPSKLQPEVPPGKDSRTDSSNRLNASRPLPSNLVVNRTDAFRRWFPRNQPTGNRLSMKPTRIFRWLQMHIGHKRS